MNNNLPTNEMFDDLSNGQAVGIFDAGIGGKTAPRRNPDDQQTETDDGVDDAVGALNAHGRQLQQVTDQLHDADKDQRRRDHGQAEGLQLDRLP